MINRLKSTIPGKIFFFSSRKCRMWNCCLQQAYDW